MKTIKNAPFYLIIIAVVKEDFTHLNRKFAKGDEWSIDQSQTRTPGYDKADEVYVVKRSHISFMGFEVYRVPMKNFELQVKTITPKYKVGDIIIHKSAGSQAIPMRIASYELTCGEIWYQSDFGESQEMAHGMLESCSRLADEAECKRSGWALERTYKKV